MKLSDIVSRSPLEPWAQEEKIPWNETGFSARMLREHLSQDHDRASRRASLIERHVEWIHRQLLESAPSRILDLGCGPGLYTSRLARRGHRCVGIDFSPASIAHARHQSERQGLPCEYRLQDLREGGFGGGFRLTLFVYGEFNVFRREQAAAILSEALASLEPGGLLVLEVHREQAVRDLGCQAPTWYAAARGLFSDRPHLCLKETSWDTGQRAAVERYFVLDAATGEVARHGATVQAYSDQEYRVLLRDTGFTEISEHASLEGQPGPGGEDLFVLVARKARAS